MKVFSTRACRHLMPTLDVQEGLVEIKNFSDGELYVRLGQEMQRKWVWVLAATPAPADNLLELYFLLDALQRAGARINLFLTYFGYARQDRAEPSEALSSELIFRFLKTFTLEKTSIVHIHNPALRRFFDFNDIILLDFFLPLAQNVDYVIAPDKGAAQVVGEIAQLAKKELIVMRKTRAGHEEVERSEISNGELKGKKVLIIDDMIATGGTIVRAAETIKKSGAQEIHVAATHGIFSGDAFERIAQSCIDRVFVTNTLEQSNEQKKITVVDCAPMIEHFFR